jgi:hypothetical protein
LAKFSEHGNIPALSVEALLKSIAALFRQTIPPGIPLLIIDLLKGNNESNVREAGATALAKLSEQSNMSFQFAVYC